MIDPDLLAEIGIDASADRVVVVRPDGHVSAITTAPQAVDAIRRSLGFRRVAEPST